MGQRAKLCTSPYAVLLLLAIVLISACSSGLNGVYDRDTRLISRLDLDQDRDGRAESRTYMVDGRPARIEIDLDNDGRVDRWEYYDADGTLLRLGTSSGRDGREDTWVYDRQGERIVEVSTAGDAVVDRREFQRNGVVVRTEQDSNRDGQIDQWATFEDGWMRELRIDSTLTAGRPDRRLLYARGGPARLELDPEGDGTFIPAQVGDVQPQ